MRVNPARFIQCCGLMSYSSHVGAEKPRSSREIKKVPRLSNETGTETVAM